MKINFIALRMERDIYNRLMYKYTILDIVTYSLSEDYQLEGEGTNLTVNLIDRFVSKKDYLLKNTLKDCINIVYNDEDLNALKNILGQSFAEFKFYSIVDIFTWCINHNKINLNEVVGLNVYSNDLERYQYNLAFEQEVYKMTYKYIDEYETSYDICTDNRTEHFLIDLKMGDIPVSFLNKIELKEEDRVYLFRETLSRNKYDCDTKTINSEELRTFLKIANHVDVKERVKEDFFTNILLHILQNKDVKKYTIITNERELDVIIYNLRGYLGKEYEFYGLYSNCVNVLSSRDLNGIIKRSIDVVSFLDELKHLLGETYALIVFKSSLYSFYQEQFSKSYISITEDYDDDILDIFSEEECDTGYITSNECTIEDDAIDIDISILDDDDDEI